MSNRDETNHASHHHHRHSQSSIVRAEGGVRFSHAADATARDRDINRVKVVNLATEDTDRASLTDRREFETRRQPKLPRPDGKKLASTPPAKHLKEKDVDDDDDDEKDKPSTSTNTSTNKSHNSSNATKSTAGEDDEGGTMLLLAAAFAFGAIVIAALIFRQMQKEKKAKEKALQAAADASADAAAAQKSVKSMTAQLNQLQDKSKKLEAEARSRRREEEARAARAREAAGAGAEAEAEEETFDEVFETFDEVIEDVPPPEVEVEDIQTKRFPQPGQRLMMIIDCVSGTDVPDVNTFGGVDPFVEFRLTSGEDPSQKKGGNVQAKAKWKVMTDHQPHSNQPQWHAHLNLDGVVWNDEIWLQVIVWDHGIGGNTGIGHTSMKVKDVLDGLGYEAHQSPPHHNDHVFKFHNLLSDTQDLRTTVITEISFAEIHKYKLHIDHGERMPKVKTIGTIDSFVEWRVEQMDVHKNPFKHKPDETCLASGKSRVVPDSIDPDWKQDFEFTVPGYTNLSLQFIVWDQGTLQNTPLIQAAIPMADIAEMSPGHEPKEFKLKFEQLPDNPCTADFKKAYIIVNAGYNHVYAKGLSGK